MIDRRINHEKRKRVSEMSPEQMRQALLVSDKTGLPNRRAFDECSLSQFVAMADVNGLKILNDQFGYSAGDVLIRRFAEILIEAGVDAYHDKGDEFLCKGQSYRMGFMPPTRQIGPKTRRKRHFDPCFEIRSDEVFDSALGTEESGATSRHDGLDYCFSQNQRKRRCGTSASFVGASKIVASNNAQET
jgi:hypothetical protein